MARRSALWLLVLGCASPPPPAHIHFHLETYQGWSETLFLESAERRVSLITVPQAGGRIVSFSQGGVNILFENPQYLGKTLSNTPPDLLSQGYIGYNVDLGPELRPVPKHLPLWMGPYTWSWKAGALCLASGPDPTVGIQIEKELRLDPVTGALRLVQTMRNVSVASQSYCLWDRTLCRGGGYALVPVNRKSRFHSGWTLLQNGVYKSEDPSHPQVSVDKGILVAHAQGPSTKIGLDSDAGWVAYAREKLLFVKYFPHFPGGPYSDGGNSVEIYFDPSVCELEPLSPEVPLIPGQEYHFPEKWMLFALDQEVATPEQARTLVKRIPPSPFPN
jgi:hypothetical protein